MNQITEIQKLYAKPKEYKIPKKVKEGEEQATLSILPLTMKQLSDIDMKDTDVDAVTQSKMIKMVAYSLGVTEDEVNQISMPFMQDLMECVQDANNIPVQQKQRINEMIAKQKKRIDGEKNESTEQIKE